jgi:hypothetical protein
MHVRMYVCNGGKECTISLFIFISVCGAFEPASMVSVARWCVVDSTVDREWPFGFILPPIPHRLLAILHRSILAEGFLCAGSSRRARVVS